MEWEIQEKALQEKVHLVLGQNSNKGRGVEDKACQRKKRRNQIRKSHEHWKR
jgi:hypothetical protein